MNDTYLDDLPNGNLYLVTQLESALNLGRCLIICFYSISIDLDSLIETGPKID